jgi:hypothetical protein
MPKAKVDPVADRLSVRTTTSTVARRDRSLDRGLDLVDTSVRTNPVFSETFAPRGRMRSKSGGRVDEVEQEMNKPVGQGLGQPQPQSQKSSKTVQDQILASQISRLNREFGLNDVYNDNRTVGIGMAPPLSKLLANSSIANSSVLEIDAKALAGDESFSMGKLSLNDDSSAVGAMADIEMVKLGSTVVVEDTEKMGSATLKVKPEVPPKRLTLKKPAQQTWNNLHVHVRQEFLGDRLVVTAPALALSSSDSNKGSPSTGSDISRRDDGDGRSMTDSNYSSYSPNFKPENVPSSMAVSFVKSCSSQITDTRFCIFP